MKFTFSHFYSLLQFGMYIWQISASQKAPQIARNADELRFSRMTVKFGKGGCTASSCSIEQVPAAYYDGWYDSTEVYKTRSAFIDHELTLAVLPTSVDSPSDRCPSSIHADIHSFNGIHALLLVIPPDRYHECTLSELESLARIQGASALLVASNCFHVYDQNRTDCPQFGQRLSKSIIEDIVSRDSGTPPHIPVVLLSRNDATRYQDCLEYKNCIDNTELLISLNWSMPDQRLSWKLWEPSSTFLNGIGDHEILEDRFFKTVLPKIVFYKFEVIYAIDTEDVVCKQNSNDQSCRKRCSTNGDYCLPGFQSAVVKPDEVLQEIVRRLCLSDILSIEEQMQWWNYIRDFHSQCENNYDKCSSSIFWKLKLPETSVKNCISSRYDSMLAAQANAYRDAKISTTSRTITMNAKIMYKTRSTDEIANFHEVLAHFCRLDGSTDGNLLKECNCADKIYGDYEAYKSCVEGSRSFANINIFWIILCSLIIFVACCAFAVMLRLYERMELRREMNAELAEMLLRYFPENTDPSKEAAKNHLGPILLEESLQDNPMNLRDTSTEQSALEERSMEMKSSIITSSNKIESGKEGDEEVKGTEKLRDSTTDLEMT